MLKISKNSGVSLIELMVALALGLTLVFSMLAFYSISQNNVITYNTANQEQQNLRKMMNLLVKDVENTGGFECAKYDDIFKTNTYPMDIISLGNNLSHKQIIFTHPVTVEHQDKALGLIEINDAGTLLNYSPVLIEESGCGQDKNSPVYIGTTIFEVVNIPNSSQILLDFTDTDTPSTATGDSISAFVSLSSVQSRRDKIDVHKTPAIYKPSLEDATVLLLSNNLDTQNDKLPFGKNDVEIFLGFSPEGLFSHVPDITITGTNAPLKNGGWINPFASTANYDLLVNKTSTTTNKATLINKLLHNGSSGNDMETYPLKAEAIRQVRAVKFQFTLDKGTTKERVLTRTVRFKNMHLLRLDQEI